MSENDQADGFFDDSPPGWYCSSESDGSQCQRTVSELSTIPYGMRLARGFAILSGNKHDL